MTDKPKELAEQSALQLWQAYCDKKMECERLHEVNQALVEALERLAKLGNGNQYGNSEGNQIAQVALSKVKEST